MGDATLAANAVLLHLPAILAYGPDGFSHATEIPAGGVRPGAHRAIHRAPRGADDGRGLPAVDDTLALVSLWSFLLDGIFVGTTRTAVPRKAMVVSVLACLGACWLPVPALGNHGPWLAFTVFMAARAITLAVVYPRLLRDI